MNLLKKVWTELNRPRALEIRWISYETESEKNNRLNSDLRKQVEFYRKKNRQYAIEKLYNWVIANALYQDGVLMPHHQAMREAIRLYNEAKADGRLDSLNSVGGANVR